MYDQLHIITYVPQANSNRVTCIVCMRIASTQKQMHKIHDMMKTDFDAIETKQNNSRHEHQPLMLALLLGFLSVLLPLGGNEGPLLLCVSEVLLDGVGHVVESSHGTGATRRGAQEIEAARHGAEDGAEDGAGRLAISAVTAVTAVTSRHRHRMAGRRRGIDCLGQGDGLLVEMHQLQAAVATAVAAVAVGGDGGVIVPDVVGRAVVVVVAIGRAVGRGGKRVVGMRTGREIAAASSLPGRIVPVLGRGSCFR